MYSGDYEGAVSSLRATPNYGTQPWAWNLMTSLAALGRLDEALAVRDTFELENPGTLNNFWGRALLLATSERLDEARDVLAASPPPPAGFAAWAAFVSATTDALGGRVASFREQLGGSVMLAGRYGSVPEQIQSGLYGPWVTAWVERDSAGVGQDVDELFAGIDYATVSPRDRLYPTQALMFAMVGDRDRVEGLLTRYSSEVDAESDPGGRVTAEVARALLDARSGDDAAVTRLEQAVARMLCNRCGDVLLGHGYETAGRPSSAIDAYERYLAHPFFDGSNALMQIFSSNVHERLGMLYEETGDAERAAEHYGAFADLWKDPDPVFRDRVSRARAKADALGGD
jgi:tetratricopeptide (TPR) repeat protein